MHPLGFKIHEIKLNKQAGIFAPKAKQHAVICGYKLQPQKTDRPHYVEKEGAKLLNLSHDQRTTSKGVSRLVVWYVACKLQDKGAS